MKPLKDLLKLRAKRIDMTRGDELVAIQVTLNEHYPSQVRARRLLNGVLTITTPSAAIAADLRWRQVELLNKLRKFQIENLKITIV